MADRWATFDCYGTLIDWNGGIRGQLARVFGDERADALLVRYHVLEPMLEADGTRSYRGVLTEAMRGLGAPDDEVDALAGSLPDWQPFPEVREALEAARGRGWKLAILSNTDRDYIAASQERIGVPFDQVIVASRSARTSRRSGTGVLSRSGSAACRTSTWRRASSTMSRRRTSSA
jgi:2-haloacid dehalogenase